MRIRYVTSILMFVLAIILIPGPVNALAYSSDPSLFLSNNASNDTVTITSQGYPNAAVEFYYYYTPSAASSGNTPNNTNNAISNILNSYSNYNYRNQYQSLGTIGYTDQNGNFSTTVNSNQYANEYGIYNGANVYVNINGQVSPIVTWQSPFNYSTATSYSNGSYPYNSYPYGTYPYGNLAPQSYPNTYYSTAYQAPSYQIPIGSYAGYSYPNNSYPNTTYAYGTYPTGYPGGYSNYPNNLSFSQTNLTLTVGQTAVVTAYNNTAYMYVYNDSNPAVATASINNVNTNMSDQISIYANSNGQATFIICNINNTCANIFVTVEPLSSSSTANSVGSGYGTYSAYTIPINTNANPAYTYAPTVSQYYNTPTISTISFSANKLNLNVGQTQSVSITGNGGYYLSYDSNSAVARGSINGNTLNVQALSPGTNTMTICQKTIPCGTIFVSVTGN